VTVFLDQGSPVPEYDAEKEVIYFIVAMLLYHVHLVIALYNFVDAMNKRQPVWHYVNDNISSHTEKVSSRLDLDILS
jgi:hypothetical protein